MIRSTVDFGRDGKQVGALLGARSTDTSAWSNLTIPIATVKAGAGPTVLVLAGNHGDEYEGQIAVARLAQELEPAAVRGRVILIPCLSTEASRAGTRTWPDGTNFNRSFPGRADGHLAEQLAYFLSNDLFPLSDVVCDIHSGGRSMRFAPMSHMHVVEDATQRTRMLEMMLSWNTDFHMLYDIDVAGGGLLPAEAERQGKTVVTTELGGGGHVAAATHRLAYRGLVNLLRRCGVIEGEPETRASLGRPDATILDARGREAYVFSPASGLYEVHVDPGEPVEQGTPIGALYSLENPAHPPIRVVAPRSGVVCAVRAIPQTEIGDCLAAIGEPIAAESLRQANGAEAASG